MTYLEQFFAFSFISVFSVAILATWLRYFPNLIKLYRTVINNQQFTSKKYSFKG